MSRVALVLVPLLAACSPVAAPSTAPGPASAEAPWGTADERVFGTIVAFDLNAPSVTLDLGKWFADPDEANAAARADGVIAPADDLPEPFYVRDLHERRAIGVDPSAAVLVLGHDEEGNILPTRVTLGEFLAHWQSGPASGAWMPAAYHWLWLKNGRVVGIEAQYTP